MIEDVITDLNEYYVYPETAQKMADGLRTHEKNGDYKAISDGDDFAALLTTHLLDVSHDKHLHVTYNPFKLTAEPPEPTPAQRAENRKDMERDCGFRKVEILPNNSGYVKFDFFADPMACGPTAAAAMAFLAHVDAIIYDLRENGGAILSMGDIAPNRTCPFAVLRPLFEPFFIACHADHRRAESEQLVRDSESDAARASGDERGLSAERPAISHGASL